MRAKRKKKRVVVCVVRCSGPLVVARWLFSAQLKLRLHTQITHKYHRDDVDQTYLVSETAMIPQLTNQSSQSLIRHAHLQLFRVEQKVIKNIFAKCVCARAWNTDKPITHSR